MFQNKIFHNFSALTAVNVLNTLFPLLTIPYLIKTLGTENYGLLAFHQYLGQFALVIFDFGFPLYAVNEVARRREDLKRLRQFVADVFFLKACIFISVALGLACVFVILKNPLSKYLNLEPILFSLFIVTAAFNSFAPTWLFQGLDQSHKTVLPTLLARTATLICIFLYVRSSEDIVAAAAASVLGAIVLATSQYYIARGWMSFAGGVGLDRLRKIFSESLQVFWSRLMIMGYVTASPILINLTAGTGGVAVYNVCEKIVGITRIPFDMFTMASFSRFSRFYQASDARKYAFGLGLGGLTVAVVSIVLVNVVNKYIPVPGLQDISAYMTIYSLALLPISVHGFLGTCVLLTNGRRMELAKSVFVGLMAYTVSVAILWTLMKDRILVSILGMVAVEFGILLSRLSVAFKYSLFKNEKI